MLFLLFWSPYHEQWLIRVASWRSTCKPYKLVYSLVCLHWFITFLSVKSMGLERKHKGEILFPDELFHPPCPTEIDGGGHTRGLGIHYVHSQEPGAGLAGWRASTCQWSTLPLVASLSLALPAPTTGYKEQLKQANFLLACFKSYIKALLFYPL